MSQAFTFAGLHTCNSSNKNCRREATSWAALPAGSCSITPSPNGQAARYALRSRNTARATFSPVSSTRVLASSNNVVAVGGAALSTTKPVRPMLVMSWAVRLIASRSTREGRHGTNTRSARCAAAAASAPAAGGVSMMVRPKPFASAASIAWLSRRALIGSTCGSSASRRSLQAVALSCGSRSNSAVFTPAACAATARFTARVVFPTPPFCAANVIICTCAHLQ